MAELIDGWRTDQRRRGLMPSTIRRRCDMIATFDRWLPRHLTNATAEDVELFLDERRTTDGHPISARTRYTYLSALGCFYDWAIRAGQADHNPTTDIGRPRLRSTLPRPVTDDELRRALEGTTGQHRIWILLAAYAGLRCAEIAGLRRDDVVTDLGMLRILGKGGKERMVPIHPLVADALATWPRPRTNAALFTRPAGGAWPADLLSRHASTMLRDLSIDATLHQFRHWFGTRTLRACKNLRTVQELMGHSSPNTTAIYTAFVNEDGRAAVHALPTDSEQDAA